MLSGLTVERAIVVDDQMRVVDEDDIYAVGECVQHRGEVYGLVAPLWEQAVVLADQVTGRDRTAAYLGSRTATKLKVAGVDVASMGLTSPEKETDEHIVFSEPKRGVFKSIVIRDDKIVGATLLGDSKKVAFLQQAFDRGLRAARAAGGADVRPRRADRGGRRRRARRRRAGLQLQRRLEEGDRRLRPRRLQDGLRGDGHDAGRQGLRHLQGPGRPAGRARRRRCGRGGPGRQLLRARHPDGQGAADGDHPRGAA